MKNENPVLKKLIEKQLKGTPFKLQKTVLKETPTETLIKGKGPKGVRRWRLWARALLLRSPFCSHG